MAARPNDWEWAKAQYETTSRPTDDIAADIGVSVTSLISKASRERWTRNIPRQVVVTAAAQALAAKTSELERHEAEKRAFYEVQARVIREHRDDISLARRHTTRLFAELQNSEEDLPTQVKILRGLSESLKTQILLERQAFNISGPLEDPEKDAARLTPEQQDTRMAHVMAVFAKALTPKEVVVVHDSGTQDSSP